MFLPPEFALRKKEMWTKLDYENSPENRELTQRLKKTLYFGKHPSTDRSSLPLTEIAVEMFQGAVPRELGQVDTFLASSYSRRACISPCAMMLGMIYVDRLKHRNPEYLKTVSSSDMFLISMMLASKYLYDEGVDEEVFSDEWAQSAKMETDEVNELERHFLAAIDWQLFVKPEDFWSMLHSVEQRIAMEQGLERGWFSYMDLIVLTENAQLYKVFRTIMLEISKVLFVCSVTYIAGAMTIFGSSVALTYLRNNVSVTGLTPFQSPVVETESLLPVGDAFAEGLCPEFTKPDTMEESVSDHQVNASRDQSGGRVPSCEKSTAKGGEIEDRGAPARESSGRTKARGLPTFLTLVLIKDAVAQFVSAIHDKYNHQSVELTDSRSWSESSSTSDNHVTCTPGCCFSGANHCWNVSDPFSLDLKNGRWSSQCKCATTMGLKSANSECKSCAKELSVGPLAKCHSCHCCCQFPQLPIDHVVTTLEMPQVDISLGFSTTSKAFVT